MTGDPRATHDSRPKVQPSTPLDADGRPKFFCGPMRAWISERMCAISQSIAAYVKRLAQAADNPGPVLLGISRLRMIRFRACGLCDRCKGVGQEDVKWAQQQAAQCFKRFDELFISEEVVKEKVREGNKAKCKRYRDKKRKNKGDDQ